MSLSFHIYVTGQHTKRVFILLSLLSVVGCTSPSPPSNVTEPKLLSSEEHSVRQEFESVYSRWQGAPYRFGGDSLNGIDCSAFVQMAYKEVEGLILPRTTKQQSRLGYAVEYHQAKVGDLVFFETSSKVYHVGVYIGNRQFMHASTSKGVIISRLDNPYWASKYWQFRRVTL